MTKSGREITEILEAFDLTGCVHSAAQLAGADRKTVLRYLALRDAGADPAVPAPRSRSVDEFLPKVEELVDRSSGKIRLLVAALRAAGGRPAPRPDTPAPGGHRNGTLRPRRCRWVRCPSQGIATRMPPNTASAERITDNAKTVTVEHVAGIPVRHPGMVALGRHYGATVASCRPFDPESKGGTEATVKIAKADLVPTLVNLAAEYSSFADLEDACEAWCQRVNSRVHRESAAVPGQRLAVERARLHPLSAEPYVLALGEERLVNDDQTIRFGSVRYSTPPGHVGERVWCRVHGGELVIVARDASGLTEIARHQLSVPGNPRIADEHYPGHPGGNGPRQPRPRPDESSISAATQNALTTLEWIGRAENLVIAGPSGTGKSHFAEALAHTAIDTDLRVAWFTLESLTAAISRAKADGSVARTVTRICRSDLIVIDLSGVLSHPSVTSASVA